MPLAAGSWKLFLFFFFENPPGKKHTIQASACVIGQPQREKAGLRYHRGKKVFFFVFFDGEGGNKEKNKGVQKKKEKEKKRKKGTNRKEQGNRRNGGPGGESPGPRNVYPNVFVSGASRRGGGWSSGNWKITR